MSSTALEVLADIEPFEQQIKGLEPAAASAAKKAGQAMDREMQRWAKTAAGRPAEEMAQAMAGIRAAGQRTGASAAASAKDVSSAWSKTGLVLDGVAGSLAGAGVAFAGLSIVKSAITWMAEFDSMALESALNLDELRGKLDDLAGVPGFGVPISPEVAASVSALRAEQAALDDIWTQTKATIATELAPALSIMGRGMVVAALVAKDLYERFLQVRGLLLSVVGAVAPVGEAFEALGGPLGSYVAQADQLLDQEQQLAIAEKTRADVQKLVADGQKHLAEETRRKSEADKDAASRARDHAAAQRDADEAAREAAAEYRTQQDAAKELFAIASAAAMENMTAEERLTAEYDAQIAKINELAQASGLVGAADAARAATTEKYWHDRDQLAQETIAAEIAKEQELHDAHMAFLAEGEAAALRVKEAHQQYIQDEVDTWMGAAQSVQQAFSEIAAAELQQQEEVIAKTQAARDAAAKAGKASEVKRLDAILEAEKKAGRTAFRADKAAKISQIAMNTATAITAALAQLGPIAGGVAAGAITAVGAIQAGIVAKQKSPYHTGGSVRAPDEVDIRARQGEYVVREGAARENKAALDELNRTGSMPGTTVNLVQLDGRTMGAIVAQAVKAPGPLRQEIERIAKGVLSNSSQGYAR